MTLEKVVSLQREYGLTNVTRDIAYRKASLERLLEAVSDNELALFAALEADLNRSRYETYLTEISQVKLQIRYAIDHLENWAKDKKKSIFPTKCYEVKEPYGVILIIAPWNYPISLTLLPLIGAIAAGNTAIVKSSSKSANTALALATLINTTFDKRYVYAIDEPISYDEIMKQKYDYIFFTGSERVGKNVMRAAATNLTPVTLELGGKSPCIIGPQADIKLAAKKIMWGKILNAGQICVAPDYVVIPKYQKEEFIRFAKEAVSDMIRDPFSNDAYPRIINLHHFMRLTKFIMGEKNLIGGRYDDKQMKIEPTIFPDATFDSPIMKDEIFGPLLPVIEYEDVYEVIDIIRRRPKPLACYIFSNNKSFVDSTITAISSGTCCINDVIVQASNFKVAFGGVGSSGMGKYHGRYSFETFSNTKSVQKSISRIDSRIKYPPYTEERLPALKKILR